MNRKLKLYTVVRFNSFTALPVDDKVNLCFTYNKQYSLQHSDISMLDVGKYFCKKVEFCSVCFLSMVHYYFFVPPCYTSYV